MSGKALTILRLRTLREKSGADGKIARFLFENLSTLPSLSLSEIGEESGTSYASVCRFFRKAGFDGFRDFRAAVKAEWDGEKAAAALDFDFPTHVPEEMTFEETSRRICDFYAGINENCKNALDALAADRIARLITASKRIYFAGLGVSALTAQYACTKFFRLNVNCSFDNDIIISSMKAALLGRGDLLFAISSSGRTKSMLKLVKDAKANGAAVVTLGDFTNTPMDALADISICTTVRESRKYMDVDFPLIQGQITVIDILYAYIYRRLKKDAAVNLSKTTSAINSEKVRP